jgi:hypothetical protein
MAASIKSKLLFPFFLVLALIVTSCGQPAPATPAVDTVASIVAATMQALTPRVPLATPTAPAIPSPSAVATFTPITANTSAANTGVPTITATPGIGALQGSVTGYPYGALPKLIFVAFNQENGRWNYWINNAGQSYYSTDQFLPEGKYQVVAYDASGHAGGCKTIVTVKANETANCDITDWIGLYPVKPGDAPNP